MPPSAQDTANATPTGMAGSLPLLPGAPDEWGALVELPCGLALELPIPSFTVRDLLRLEPENIIDTCWSQSSDIPLRANGELIAWTEFEVVGERLAARLTELA